MHDKPRPDVRGLEGEAYQQNGYFTVRQAREHGISSQLLNHYTRRERFDRVRRGLYRLRGFPRDEQDEVREKWMAVGTEKAVLSHESATAAAFRQALDDRLKAEAAVTGLGVARLRKRVAFELFLRRLVAVAPDRWVLKGALALDFRLEATTRPTKDIDLGRDDDEQAAIEDMSAAQQLALDDFFTYAAN